MSQVPARSGPVEFAAVIEGLDSEHRAAMIAYAATLTGDRALSEDLVQEALIRAWRHPDMITNGRGSVRGWLLTTVRNLAIDQFRARRARPREVAGVESVVGPVQADRSDAVLARVVLTDLMAQIQPDQRAVLAHLYLAGRSVSETSAALDVPEGTVKSRSYYALRTLRAMLDDDAHRSAA